MIGYSEAAECQSTNDDGNLVVTTALDGCGVAHAAGDGVILFSNTLSVFARTSNNGIITASDVNIPVECSFDVSVSNVGSSNVVEKPASTSGTTGAGSFSFVAEYYTTEDFTETVVGDETINVGQTLYFGIRPSTLITDVRFYVNECTVSDGTNNFGIFENMCPNDFIVSDTSDFVNTDLFTMNHLAFQFMGSEEELSDMTVSCGLTVCLDGECPADPAC